MPKKFKHITVDENTYQTIKNNADAGNRSQAGEVRNMLVIVTDVEKHTGKYAVMAQHADGRTEVLDTFVDPETQIEIRQAGIE